MTCKTTNNSNSVTQYYYEKAPCNQSTWGTGTLATGSRKVTVGMNTPGFRRLLAKRALLPFTDFAQIEESVTASGSHDYGTTDGSCACMPCRHYWGDALYGTAPHGFTFLDNASNMCNAVSGILKDISSVTATNAAANAWGIGFDGLTFLAELRSTLDMFHRRLLTPFLKWVLDNRARAEREGWENPWLEWRYGWRTLYYDIRDFTKAMNRTQKSFERVRGSATGSAPSSTTVTLLPAPSSVFDGNLVMTVEKTIHCKASYIADAYVPRMHFDPIVTAWELIPYSFVVDWFINIGDYIKALRMQSIATASVAGVGSLVTVNTSVYADVHVKTGSVYGYNWSGSINYTFNSTVLHTFRTPSSATVPPSFNPRLNLERAIDAIALLRQIFKR